MKLPILSRFISLVISISLLLPPGSFLPLAESAIQTGNSHFSVPEIPLQYGTVEKFHKGSTKKVIYFIQDAHDSLEAQEHIAALIEHLVEQRGIRTVFEEGYEGTVPTDDFFGSIADPLLRRRVSYFYLDQLRIGGAEYAHINRKSNFRLIGADRLELHARNNRWYRLALEAQPAIDRDIDAIEFRLREMSLLHFRKTFQNWLKSRAHYRSGALDLSNYLLQTTVRLQKTGYSEAEFKSNFPAIAFLLSVKDANQTQENNDFLDGRQIFAELYKLERITARRLLIDEVDYRLFELQEVLRLLRALSKIELDADAYNRVRDQLRSLTTADFAEFVYESTGAPVVFSKQWEMLIQNAVQFYETARARDDAVRGPVYEFFRKNKEDVAVLVFGGFHKDRIERLLESIGFSYFVISPRITKISSKHQKRYRALMARTRDAAAPFSFLAAAASRLQPVLAFPDRREEIRHVAEAVERFPEREGDLLNRSVVTYLSQIPGQRSELKTNPREELLLLPKEFHSAAAGNSEQIAALLAEVRPFLSDSSRYARKPWIAEALQTGTAQNVLETMDEEFRETARELTRYLKRLNETTSELIEAGGFRAEPNIRTSEEGYAWGPSPAHSFILKALGVVSEAGHVIQPALLRDWGISSQSKVAERWFLSDDTKFPSWIMDEGLAVPLFWILRSNPEAVLGDQHASELGPSLGMIMKYLDAAEPLSWQVHLGITEGYVVVQAKNGSGLFLGVNEPSDEIVRREIIQKVLSRLEEHDPKVLRFPAEGVETQLRNFDDISELTRTIRDHSDWSIAELLHHLLIAGRNVIDVAELGLVQSIALVPGERLITNEGSPHALFGAGDAATATLIEFKATPTGEAHARKSTSDQTWALSDNLYGKQPRKQKVTRERLSEAIETVRELGYWRKIHPSDYKHNGNEGIVLESNLRVRLLHNEAAYAAQEITMPSGTQIYMKRSGRHSAFVVLSGTLEIYNKDDELLMQLSRQEEALVTAAEGDLLLVSTGTEPVVLIDFFRPIRGSEPAEIVVPQIRRDFSLEAYTDLQTGETSNVVRRMKARHIEHMIAMLETSSVRSLISARAKRFLVDSVPAVEIALRKPDYALLEELKEILEEIDSGKILFSEIWRQDASAQLILAGVRALVALAEDDQETALDYSGRLLSLLDEWNTVSQKGLHRLSIFSFGMLVAAVSSFALYTSGISKHLSMIAMGVAGVVMGGYGVLDWISETIEERQNMRRLYDAYSTRKTGRSELRMDRVDFDPLLKLESIPLELQSLKKVVRQMLTSPGILTWTRKLEVAGKDTLRISVKGPAEEDRVNVTLSKLNPERPQIEFYVSDRSDIIRGSFKNEDAVSKEWQQRLAEISERNPWLMEQPKRLRDAVFLENGLANQIFWKIGNLAILLWLYEPRRYEGGFGDKKAAYDIHIMPVPKIKKLSELEQRPRMGRIVFQFDESEELKEISGFILGQGDQQEKLKPLRSAIESRISNLSGKVFDHTNSGLGIDGNLMQFAEGAEPMIRIDDFSVLEALAGAEGNNQAAQKRSVVVTEPVLQQVTFMKGDPHFVAGMVLKDRTHSGVTVQISATMTEEDMGRLSSQTDFSGEPLSYSVETLLNGRHYSEPVEILMFLNADGTVQNVTSGLFEGIETVLDWLEGFRRKPWNDQNEAFAKWKIAEVPPPAKPAEMSHPEITLENKAEDPKVMQALEKLSKLAVDAGLFRTHQLKGLIQYFREISPGQVIALKAVESFSFNSATPISNYDLFLQSFPLSGEDLKRGYHLGVWKAVYAATDNQIENLIASHEARVQNELEQRLHQLVEASQRAGLNRTQFEALINIFYTHFPEMVDSDSSITNVYNQHVSEMDTNMGTALNAFKAFHAFHQKTGGAGKRWQIPPHMPISPYIWALIHVSHFDQLEREYRSYENGVRNEVRAKSEGPKSVEKTAAVRKDPSESKAEDLFSKLVDYVYDPERSHLDSTQVMGFQKKLLGMNGFFQKKIDGFLLQVELAGLTVAELDALFSFYWDIDPYEGIKMTWDDTEPSDRMAFLQFYFTNPLSQRSQSLHFSPDHWVLIQGMAVDQSANLRIQTLEAYGKKIETSLDQIIRWSLELNFEPERFQRLVSTYRAYQVRRKSSLRQRMEPLLGKRFKEDRSKELQMVYEKFEAEHPVPAEIKQAHLKLGFREETLQLFLFAAKAATDEQIAKAKEKFRSIWADRKRTAEAEAARQSRDRLLGEFPKVAHDAGISTHEFSAMLHLLRQIPKPVPLSRISLESLDRADPQNLARGAILKMNQGRQMSAQSREAGYSLTLWKLVRSVSNELIEQAVQRLETLYKDEKKTEESTKPAETKAASQGVVAESDESSKISLAFDIHNQSSPGALRLNLSIQFKGIPLVRSRFAIESKFRIDDFDQKILEVRQALSEEISGIAQAASEGSLSISDETIWSLVERVAEKTKFRLLDIYSFKSKVETVDEQKVRRMTFGFEDQPDGRTWIVDMILNELELQSEDPGRTRSDDFRSAVNRELFSLVQGFGSNQENWLNEALVRTIGQHGQQGLRLRSELRYYNRSDTVTAQAPVVRSWVEQWETTYTVVMDLVDFETLSYNQRAEFYAFLEASSLNHSVEFIFNASMERIGTPVYEELRAMRALYPREIRLAAQPGKFELKGQGVVYLSREGRVSVLKEQVEEAARSTGIPFVHAVYVSHLTRPGLLTAALLLLEYDDASRQNRMNKAGYFSEVPETIADLVEHFIRSYVIITRAA